MKTLIYLLAFFLTLAFSTQDLNCQIRNIVKRTKKETTKSINKSIGDGLNNLLNPKDDNKNKENEDKEADKKEEAEQALQPQGANKQEMKEESKSPMLVWAKYDFVPGDKIIFEDNLTGEENGEFPSRWDLVAGTVENAEFGGENVIMFRGGQPTIIPYLKNSKIDYLPDVFTVDFDLYLPSDFFTILFYDKKNQSSISGGSYLQISSTRMNIGSASSQLPDNKSIAKKWSHVSIAYTSGKLKTYLDETRLINIPHLGFNPTGISFHAYHASDNRPFYIKNIRIAEGGVKYYDRFLQDGKIVSNGIRFDVGRATLRPESMGVVNEIFNMLSEHPEIKVSIEGHTDSDGDSEVNQKLSEERADAVMNQLLSMGISEDRLVSRGFGESKPLVANDTPEGKAANRRVEFIKIDSVN